MCLAAKVKVNDSTWLLYKCVLRDKRFKNGDPYVHTYVHTYRNQIRPGLVLKDGRWRLPTAHTTSKRFTTAIRGNFWYSKTYIRTTGTRRCRKQVGFRILTIRTFERIWFKTFVLVFTYLLRTMYRGQWALLITAIHTKYYLRKKHWTESLRTYLAREPEISAWKNWLPFWQFPLDIVGCFTTTKLSLLQQPR